MTNPDRKEKLSILDENDVELFIKSDSGYGRTIANFRATGMRVGKYSRRILQHYAAVLIVRGEKLNELLKDTEPPKHNRWDYKLIEKHEHDKRKKAKECIDKIEINVLEILKEQYETISEDIIDSDTGDFIPDVDADFGDDVVGDDVLRVKHQLGVPRSHVHKPPDLKDNAKENEGKEKDKTIIQDEDKRQQPNNPKPRPAPIVDNDNLNKESGFSNGQGRRSIPAVDIIKQKVFPINIEQGLHKTIIQTREDYSNVYISFSVMGEDGSSEKLNIRYYTILGEKYPQTNHVGPLDLQKDTMFEMIVSFESNEKMVIRPVISGGRVS